MKSDFWLTSRNFCIMWWDFGSHSHLVMLVDFRDTTSVGWGRVLPHDSHVGKKSRFPTWPLMTPEEGAPWYACWACSICVRRCSLSARSMVTLRPMHVSYNTEAWCQPEMQPGPKISRRWGCLMIDAALLNLWQVYLCNNSLNLLYERNSWCLTSIKYQFK